MPYRPFTAVAPPRHAPLHPGFALLLALALGAPMPLPATEAPPPAEPPAWDTVTPLLQANDTTAALERLAALTPAAGTPLTPSGAWILLQRATLLQTAHREAEAIPLLERLAAPPQEGMASLPLHLRLEAELRLVAIHQQAGQWKQAGQHSALAQLLAEETRTGEELASALLAGETPPWGRQPPPAPASADPAAAVARLEEALDQQEGVLGQRLHPALVQPLLALARHWRQQGEVELASSYYERALEHYMNASGPYHAGRVALLQEMSGMCQQRGQHPRALARLGTARTILENVWGKDHPATIPLLLAEAESHRQLGQLEQGDQALRKALALTRQARGEEHPETIALLFRLAAFYLESQRLPAAGQTLDQISALLGQHSPPDPRLFGRLLTSQAALLLAKQRPARAEAQQRQAVQLLNKALGPDQAPTREARQRHQEMVTLLEQQRHLTPPASAMALVRRVQQRLAFLGHSPGAPDGDPGPRTRKAITAFAQEMGLHLNPRQLTTRESLLQILSHLPPSPEERP